MAVSYASHTIQPGSALVPVLFESDNPGSDQGCRVHINFSWIFAAI
jgi:hypothetical protein